MRIRRWFFLLSGFLLALAVLTLVIFVAINWAPPQAVEQLRQQWAPPPSRFLELDGMQVHYRDEGPADDPVPLILIHGTASSLHTWEGWVRELKSERRVISMDLPGFGLTGPRPDHDYSNAAYTHFILSLMDQLQIPQAVIGGNSLGAEIGWNVALAAPNRIAKLILIDSPGYAFVPKSIPPGFQMAGMPILSWLVDYTMPRRMMEASVRDVYGNPDKVTPELVERYMAMMRRDGNRAALRQRLQQLDRSDHSAEIRNLHLPVLILWGGKDQLIPPENAALFARDIADSRLIMFDDLGHVPQEENPVVTAAAAKIFLMR